MGVFRVSQVDLVDNDDVIVETLAHLLHEQLDVSDGEADLLRVSCKQITVIRQSVRDQLTIEYEDDVRTATGCETREHSANEPKWNVFDTGETLRPSYPFSDSMMTSTEETCEDPEGAVMRNT